MPSDSFQIAAERAATSCPADAWFLLRPSQRAAAIYRELRKLDAESVKEQRRPPAERLAKKGHFTEKPPQSTRSARPAPQRDRGRVR
jgi:hypothetical protein